MGKIVNSHLVEFGYELLSVLPYAYHLFEQSSLDGTVSGIDTASLYYFSPNHTEVTDKKRAFLNILAAKHDGIPNTTIHRPELDWDVWSPPPLKERYKKDAITFDKPTVCICNRYSNEWNQPPINYFDIPTLRKLFEMLQDKYQVVYVSIEGHPFYYDNNEELNMGAYDMIKAEYPDVKIIHDINLRYNASFNKGMLRVFAGCERFITMNGGFGILASYFGGENIIYSKECQEINPKINSFNRWYYRLGGSFINHVNTYEKLFKTVEEIYVKDNVGEVFILYNTKNRKITREKVVAIKNYNPIDRVVVYSDSFATTHYLEGLNIIINTSLYKSKNNTSISDDDIKLYGKNKKVTVIDIQNSIVRPRRVDISGNHPVKHRIVKHNIPDNKYEEYDDIGTEQFVYSKVSSSPEIVIYTALSENYRFKRDDIICFKPTKTDNEVMDAKRFKILGHEYFPNAKYLIWIDGNIFLKIPPKELVDKYLGKNDLAIFKHPHRDCLYKEANTIRDTQRLQTKSILEGLHRQQKQYEAECFPLNFGLWECNFFIRRNIKEVNDLFNDWWKEINKYQQRDQVSFPYVVKKHAMNIKLKTITSGDIRENTDFIYLNHY